MSVHVNTLWKSDKMPILGTTEGFAMTHHAEGLKYRLGLDLGTGSLGWAVLELDQDGVPCRIVRMGSRIFGSGREPKTLTSLAADRRQARQMRRRRDRYIQRRTRLMHELVAAGLMPDDEAGRQALKNLDPFELRARGIAERLEPYHVGRALYHLQQRRGFKSNRKADRGNVEKSAMKQAIRDLDAAMGEDETVGSYMWRRIQEGKRARVVPEKLGAKNAYEFYVDRAMIEREFDRLWETQSTFHPGLLTDTSKSLVSHAIFDQRPLKPVDPGRCTLEPEHKRAPLALVSTQLFRIYQELNALRVTDDAGRTLAKRPLTRTERDAGVAFLRARAKASLPALKKEIFGRAAVTLSLEAGERAHILGDIVSAELAKPSVIGARWWDLSLSEQDAIAEVIDGAENDEVLIDQLQGRCGLTSDEAEGAAEAALPEGYSRLSAAAIGKILPHLIDDWDTEKDAALTYDRAVVAAGYASHSDLHGGELFDSLPYYGKVLRRHTQDLANRDSFHVRNSANADEWEFGKVANPTVHVGLNQVRTVVNSLVDRYGPPTEIHVEVARDLGQSGEGRREASSKRAQNEKANDALRAELAALSQRDNFANRERLKLFNELSALNHVCVLTGISIAKSRLFTNDYQVDHALPYSRTLDDSLSNKILVHHTANQYKKARSPFEAYGNSAEWPAILDRAEAAYGKASPKFRRFSEDAMERYENGEQDFIARQLTDTSYLARLTREYVASLAMGGDDGFHPERVVAMPGRLTALLRGKWGLNSLLSDTGEKERSDHRHHAVDALVIALSDRSKLKAVTEANKKAEDKYRLSNDAGVKKLLDDLPLPWDGFADDAQAAVDRIVVSHKPDHNERGQLHEETAYGVSGGPDKQGRYLVAKSGEAAKSRLVVPMYRDGEGPDSALPYKAYIGGSNYCVEIVRTSKGRWDGEIVPRFDANGPEYQQFMRDVSRFRAQSFLEGDLVMRLIAGDVIAVESLTGRHFYVLYVVESDGRMTFAQTTQGNVAKRNGSGGDLTEIGAREAASIAAKGTLTPKTVIRTGADGLRGLAARRVFIDPMGRVFDPGFSG